MNEKQLIGMKEQDAIDLIDRNNLLSRIVVRDGEYAISVRDFDFKTDRINLYINNGKVYDVSKG